MKRPCLDCGRPTLGTRCPEHERAYRLPYTTPGYRARRAAVIEAEPWCHTAPVCPYPDSGTPANPLTADHSVPLAQGGGSSQLVPLCRRCNGSRGDGTWFYRANIAPVGQAR